MDLVYGKKKDILRSLFIGENWTWRIIKISKRVVVECKKNNFKKPARRFERHHADEYEFSKTASAFLKDKIMPFDDWVDYIEKHEKTYLLTKEEHANWEKNSKKTVLYDVDLERNLFRNESRGWKHQKKEEEYIKELVAIYKL
jgi:hypothetical protein